MVVADEVALPKGSEPLTRYVETKEPKMFELSLLFTGANYYDLGLGDSKGVSFDSTL